MWMQDQADFIGEDIDPGRLQRCGASIPRHLCRHQCFGWSVRLWVLVRLCMAFLTCFLDPLFCLLNCFYDFLRLLGANTLVHSWMAFSSSDLLIVTAISMGCETPPRHVCSEHFFAQKVIADS